MSDHEKQRRILGSHLVRLFLMICLVKVLCADCVPDSSYCNKQPECTGACMENVVPGFWNNTGDPQ